MRTETVDPRIEVERLVSAALTVAASEWDPRGALPRGQMIRLATRHVVDTLTRHGYVSGPDRQAAHDAVVAAAGSRLDLEAGLADIVGAEGRDEP